MGAGLTPTLPPSSQPLTVAADRSVLLQGIAISDTPADAAESFFAATPTSVDHFLMPVSGRSSANRFSLKDSLGTLVGLLRHGRSRSADTLSARYIADASMKGSLLADALVDATNPSVFSQMYHQGDVWRDRGLETLVLLSQAGSTPSLEALFSIARKDASVLEDIIDVLDSPKKHVVLGSRAYIMTQVAKSLVLADKLANLASEEFPHTREIASSMNIDEIVLAYIHAPPNGTREPLRKLLVKYGYLENAAAVDAIMVHASEDSLKVLLGIYEISSEEFRELMVGKLQRFNIRGMVKSASYGRYESVKLLNKLAGIDGGRTQDELIKLDIEKFVPAAHVAKIDAILALAMLAVNGNSAAQRFVKRSLGGGIAQRVFDVKSSRSLKTLVWLAVAGNEDAKDLLGKYDIDDLILWTRSDQRLLKHFLSLHMFGHSTAMKEAMLHARIPVLHRFFARIDPRIFILEARCGNDRAAEAVSFLMTQKNVAASRGIASIVI